MYTGTDDRDSNVVSSSQTSGNDSGSNTLYSLIGLDIGMVSQFYCQYSGQYNTDSLEIIAKIDAYSQLGMYYF